MHIFVYIIYNVYIAIDNQFDAYGFGRAHLPRMYVYAYVQLSDSKKVLHLNISKNCGM